MAYRLARFAMRGKCSLTRIPGTLAAMDPNGPRTYPRRLRDTARPCLSILRRRQAAIPVRLNFLVQKPHKLFEHIDVFGSRDSRSLLQDFAAAFELLDEMSDAELRQRAPRALQGE